MTNEQYLKAQQTLIAIQKLVMDTDFDLDSFVAKAESVLHEVENSDAPLARKSRLSMKTVVELAKVTSELRDRFKSAQTMAHIRATIRDPQLVKAN